MRTRTPRTSFRTGFTLIEVLMVVVLIALVTGMALPKISGSRFRADAAMRTVQGGLQQAQRAAIQQQTDVIVSFDTAQGQIRIVHDQNSNHAIDPGETVQWRNLEEGTRFGAPPKRINGSDGTAVAGGNLSSLGGFPTVYYRRDGAASTSFEVYVRSATDKMADFRSLSVSQATGRVELYRLNPSLQWIRGSL